MRTNLIVIVLLIFYFTSCKEKINDSGIIEMKSTVKANISKIIKDFNFIALETNEESLIGYVDKMQVVGDRIYILDIFSAKGLLIFDINGKYINKISRIGNGPGEFLIPISFCEF